MNDLTLGAAWPGSATRVVIFDLWQTLADAEQRPSGLFHTHLKALHVCSEAQFLRRLATSDVFLRDVPIDASLRTLFLSLGLSECNAVDAFIAAWKAMAETAFVYDGAPELLESLRARGYQLCLLTNSDKYGFECSNVVSRLPRFDYTFVSYQHGLAKPDTRCWESIARHFKTGYAQMLMIGDSSAEDIVPADHLGLHTMLLGAGAEDIARLAKTF